MRKEQREHAISLLFGNMLNSLDQLRTEGITVPSEVYLHLGMLQGNVSGIMDHIQVNHDCDIARLKQKLAAARQSDVVEPEEPEEAESAEEQLELDNVVKIHDKP